MIVQILSESLCSIITKPYIPHFGISPTDNTVPRLYLTMRAPKAVSSEASQPQRYIMFELLDALLLARIQFAFTEAFQIIFPAFSIGLASYLFVLGGLWLWTGRDVYLRGLYNTLAFVQKRLSTIQHGSDLTNSYKFLL